MISLLDAFTTAPMLSAYWYKKSEEELKGISKFFSRLSKNWNNVYAVINRNYKNILEWCLEHKKVVVITIFIIMVFIFYLSRFIGQNFSNYTDNGLFTVNLQSAPGADLNQIDSYTYQVEKFLSEQKSIDTYYSLVGQNQESHLAQISITMKPLNHRKISTQDMIKITRDFLKKNFETNSLYRELTNNQTWVEAAGSGVDRIFP